MIGQVAAAVVSWGSLFSRTFPRLQCYAVSGGEGLVMCGCECWFGRDLRSLRVQMVMRSVLKGVSEGETGIYISVRVHRLLPWVECPFRFRQNALAMPFRYQHLAQHRPTCCLPVLDPGESPSRLCKSRRRHPSSSEAVGEAVPYSSVHLLTRSSSPFSCPLLYSIPLTA